MRTLNIKRLKNAAAPLTLAAAIALSTVPAFAADTAAITGPAISQARNAGELAFAVTLNGTNQAPTSNAVTTAVVDNSGNAAGWRLTMSAIQFTDGLKTLSADALTVSAASSASNGTGTYTAPTNGIGYPVQLSSTAATYFNAAADSGMGQFTVSPTNEARRSGHDPGRHLRQHVDAGHHRRAGISRAVTFSDRSDHVRPDGRAVGANAVHRTAAAPY